MHPPFQPPDLFHLQAAQGWVELGNAVEAGAELRKLGPERGNHPEVLKVRWGICAVKKEWEAAADLAAALVDLEPEVPLGWVHRSYALHELKRTEEARDNLLSAVDKFPASATMRYNLACYECQLGHLAAARAWLEKAFRLGDPAGMKACALDDPDLEPLWAGLRST